MLAKQQSFGWNILGQSIVMLGLSFAPSVWAALPDESTYNYVTKRYSLFLHSSRDGCSRYASPEDIIQKGSIRGLPVLIVRGEQGGTLCNGVFRFESLRVDCKNNLVAYNDYIGSPANWKESKPYEDKELAQKICKLPAKPMK